MIGQQLRELRKYHAKRLKDLAETTGLSVSYLSDIERNRRCVFDTTLATLNKILACYGLEAKIVFEKRVVVQPPAGATPRGEGGTGK